MRWFVGVAVICPAVLSCTLPPGYFAEAEVPSGFRSTPYTYAMQSIARP